MALLNWVKLPTGWIRGEHGGLRDLRWTAELGANNVAALMILIVIAHHAELGAARLTYDQLSQLTSLSRAKVSGGLKVLATLGVIKPRATGHSQFELTDFNPKSGWAKLPASRLYTHGRVTIFSEMTLRKPVELHALKLYLLFVAMRDDDTNLAHLTYRSIEDYTGVDGHAIKRALNVLAANGAVHIEHVPSTQSQYGIANAYRIAGIDDRRHRGTVHRAWDGGRNDLNDILSA
jgi:hypothetical protein